MSDDELRAEYEKLKVQVAQGQERKSPGEEESSALRELLERVQTLLQAYDQKLAEARAQIAQLERELFGPKSERLTREQQEQMHQLLQDVEAEGQRPGAESAEVLEGKEAEKRPLQRRRGVRHPLPAHLKIETVTIEPPLRACPACGKLLCRIGEEVSEEIDLIPAQLIRRRTVRPKYACPCGEAGVAVAPLPPRLIPQSKLGLGLAVHIVLARFDDHLSFYRLEQQFLERHNVIIPRPQMVQWVEHIASWLQPLYDRMWTAMKAGGYLQVDETPVRVLDPEVKGKAARGYLWFYAVPGGDVILEFDRSRGQEPVRRCLQDFVGTIQTDAYEVYDALCRQKPTLERIGCLAHARRYLYEAVRENLSMAVWFISQDPFVVPHRGRNPGTSAGGAPCAAAGTGAGPLGRPESQGPGTPADAAAPEHSGQGPQLFLERVRRADRVSARRALRDRQQPGGECHPPHGGGAQTLAVSGPSRRRLAQRRDLLPDRELPTPRPQPPGISHRCPGSPTGIKDQPAGAVATRQLEAADHQLQLSGDPATTSPDQSSLPLHHDAMVLVFPLWETCQSRSVLSGYDW